MLFSAIILAAGKGKRFGCKKQNLLLEGKPLWKYIKDNIEKEFDEVLVVGVDFKGGKRRQDSVNEGLNRCSGKYVVIFDSARPLVSLKQVRQIKKAVKKYESVSFGCVPVNTMLRQNKWERESLISLQVPQAFDRVKLLEACKNTLKRNDECSVYYWTYKIMPKILKGDVNLYKITHKGDYEIIKALWKKF